MGTYRRLYEKKYPVKNDVTVLFLGEKTEGMSTGSRNVNSELKILTKGRINRDDYQFNILSTPGLINELHTSTISSIIISHVDSMRDMVDNLLEINKINKYSQIHHV